MSKKDFTEKELKILSQNKYVNSVTSKKITYTNEFKLLLIAAHDNGKTTKQIFEECGFDVETLGMIRIKAAGKRWRRTFKEEGILGLNDGRKLVNKKTINKSLTLKEQNSRLEAQVKLLKAENELLKKIELLERGMKIKK
jgi:transposase-like protein